VLLDGERRHNNGRNAGETEPVHTPDALQRLEDFVSDTEVDVKPYERSTIEARVDRKPRTTFGSSFSSAIASPTMNVKKSGSSMAAASWSRSRSEVESPARP
jgi:hypothetical protein